MCGGVPCPFCVPAAGNRKGNVMKFKERMSKQNNSVKVLLKKLKRHDTVVVAIAVAIALILSGGLIYLTTPAVTASAKQEFEESEKESNEKTIEKLDELSEYLTGLDKSLEESQKSISSFNEISGTNSDKVSEKVTGIGNDMSTLHTTISSTQTNIERLKETIEKGSELSSKERADSLLQIDNELDAIKEQYDRAQENTKSLMDEIQAKIKSGDESITKEMSDQYTDLLKKLGALNTQMADENSKAIDSITTLNTSMDDSFSSLNTSMDDSFSSLNTSITNQFTNISQGQINNTEELKALIGSYHQAVTDSFTSVANGKQLVASALATKNIQVADDASFEEICNGIMSIETQVVAENLVGEVVFTYHHHTNGEDGIGDSNEIIDDQYGNDYESSVQGGCFTRPYYHIYYSKPMQREYQLFHATNKNGNDYVYWGCGACSSWQYKYDDFYGCDNAPIHQCGTVTVDKWTSEPTAEESSYVTEVRYVRGCDRVSNQILSAVITY